MPGIFTRTFDTPAYKGTVSVPTGLFIDGQFVDGSSNTTIDVIDPSTGDVVTQISEGTSTDVDRAVKAAQRAFETSWGLNCPGTQRGLLLTKLADLMAKNADVYAALEALDVGKAYTWARGFDVEAAIGVIRYYAGWADKIHGDTIETSEAALCYTRREPFGVVGQILPWNFPLMLLTWKIGPALATGNTIVLKPSEHTPLSALFTAQLMNEAGFPPGVFNLVNGYGNTVGQAIADHMEIEKVAFTGSLAVGRKIMRAAADTNLKNVTLELGGKNPSIIFDDANIDEAVSWTVFGAFFNQGQVCGAGSKIFIHAKVYDEFLAKFTEKIKAFTVGDPFDSNTFQGPQISQTQYDRIMSYIESGKQDGATVHLGGSAHARGGFFIAPTIFTDVRPEMRIAREEIFGPVCVVIRFEDEADIVRKANDSVYGLAAAVFTRDVTRAVTTAHKLKAGTVWINCVTYLFAGVPFGGFKQSGIGQELGEYALHNYTCNKAVQLNLGIKM